MPVAPVAPGDPIPVAPCVLTETVPSPYEINPAPNLMPPNVAVVATGNEYGVTLITPLIKLIPLPIITPPSVLFVAVDKVYGVTLIVIPLILIPLPICTIPALVVEAKFKDVVITLIVPFSVTERVGPILTPPCTVLVAVARYVLRIFWLICNPIAPTVVCLVAFTLVSTTGIIIESVTVVTTGKFAIVLII